SLDQSSGGLPRQRAPADVRQVPVKMPQEPPASFGVDAGVKSSRADTDVPVQSERAVVPTEGQIPPRAIDTDAMPVQVSPTFRQECRQLETVTAAETNR